MNYVELKTQSKVGLAILKKAQAATHWKGNNGIERIDLAASDFDGDPKIRELIDTFDCEATRKLSIFRFLPYTCHAWHVDAQRLCAINMLLDGWDYITLYGKRVDAINFESVEKLVYQPDSYYLLNTKKWHTVANFSQPRYLVSIGIPEKYTFMDVLRYATLEGT